MNIKIEVLKQPSRSKGYARYSVYGGDQPLITSRTGNVWVSGTTKEGEVTEGSMIVLTSDGQYTTGQGHRAHQETTEKKWELVATEGETVELEHAVGSQSHRLRITGARLAGAGDAKGSVRLAADLAAQLPAIDAVSAAQRDYALSVRAGWVDLAVTTHPDYVAPLRELTSARAILDAKDSGPDSALDIQRADAERDNEVAS